MYTKPHERLILLLGYRTTHLRDEVEKFMFALVNECHGCTEMSLSKSDSVTILVVEETLGSLGACRISLNGLGQKTIFVSGLDEAMKKFLQKQPDLVFIQISSPKDLDFCEWVRSQSNVPILAITDRKSIIDSGANDYLVRPLSKAIVNSRAAQQLSRSRLRSVINPNINLSIHENLKIDLSSYQFFVDDLEVAISTSEFRLLEAFIKSPHRVFNQMAMLEIIGVPFGPGSDHIINSHISRLRLKIRRAGGPDVFVAVRGVGFRLLNGKKIENNMTQTGGRSLPYVSR